MEASKREFKKVLEDMLKSKSDAISDDLKADGNVFFKRAEWYNALMCYNKSLCFAESKEKQALAYGNRSAVFMQVKKYEECWQNIQWAKEFYPPEKIKNLAEREERCKKLMEEAKDPKDDAWEYFKLSYPPNPKIPFIIDGLEIRDTGDGRKGIFTTRDLKPGDVISSEEPCFRRLFCGGQYNRCCLCLKVNNMNLLACLKTASLMFCSEKCRTTTYEDYDIESMLVYASMNILSDRIFTDFSKSFGGEKKLCKFLRENDLMKLKYTYFDFDWSDENEPKYQENKLKCLLSMNMPDPPPYVPFLDFKPPFKMHQVKNELKQLITHLNVAVTLKLFHVAYLNYQYAQQVCGEAIHDGIFAGSFSNLLQHSCMPNVSIVEAVNKMFLIISRKVKSGEQLFKNETLYRYHTSTPQNRALILTRKCNCYICVNNLKPQDFMVKNPKLIEEFVENSEIAHKKVDRLKKELKNNWAYIAAHCDDLLSGEVPRVTAINEKMLAELAYLAAFPC